MIKSGFSLGAIYNLKEEHMIKESVRILYIAVGGVLIFQLVGCGTILYPERKGQRSGRIDVGVALLDGIGLFFFLIPGVIAYAVDFSNGTIYLPGSLSRLQGYENIREVKFDQKHMTSAELKNIIQKQTGVNINFDQSNLMVTQVKSTNAMKLQFALAMPSISNNRLVSVR